MKTLIISGSPRNNSHSIAIAKIIEKQLKKKGAEYELLDLAETVLEPFKGYNHDYNETTMKVVKAMRDFDLFIIVTPIYNASFSSAVKNLFEHAYYKDLRGKVASFALISSGKISALHVKNQLASMVGYFNIFAHPKAVYILEDDFEKTELKNEKIEERLEDFTEESLDFAKRLTKNPSE